MSKPQMVQVNARWAKALTAAHLPFQRRTWPVTTLGSATIERDAILHVPWWVFQVLEAFCRMDSIDSGDLVDWPEVRDFGQHTDLLARAQLGEDALVLRREWVRRGGRHG